MLTLPVCRYIGNFVKCFLDIFKRVSALC